ncbi:hypothetical protein N9E75_03440 [Gammaproteobacteria bacterium]|nr:hypothetical protein [Gammaproteobacteria bacterium]
MKYKYRFPDRKLDVIVHCSTCFNTKAFPAFSMHNYERLTCHKCSAKHPELHLPYTDDHETDEDYEYSFIGMELLRESHIIENLDNLLPDGRHLGIEYVTPKPCIHCGVIDHKVDLAGIGDEVWFYMEQNLTEKELWSQTRFDNELSIALDSKKGILTKHGLTATCVSCTEKIILENEEPPEFNLEDVDPYDILMRNKDSSE